MAVIDLDKEFPEEDIIKFKSREGKLYEIALFIPAAVGDTIIGNIDIITAMFPEGSGIPKFSKESITLGLKILADICHEQHEEIDGEWIKKNISLPRQAIILFKLIKPIHEFMFGAGFMNIVTPAGKSATQ